MLGKEGHGFAPIQIRLGSRRLEMAANCVGMAQRALDMMCEYAPQRKTFGAMGMTLEMPLSMMANKVRLMRIYDGAREVHRMVVARNKLRNYVG